MLPTRAVTEEGHCPFIILKILLQFKSLISIKTKTEPEMMPVQRKTETRKENFSFYQYHESQPFIATIPG